MKFADKIIKSRNHLIRTVISTYNGRAAWWIVKVNPQKYEIFKIKLAEGINLDEYGKVLYKGWGEAPPEDIIKDVEEEYS